MDCLSRQVFADFRQCQRLFPDSEGPMVASVRAPPAVLPRPTQALATGQLIEATGVDSVLRGINDGQVQAQPA